MKDDLQKWMDKHLMVMTLSDDKKQEKKIKKAIETKVRESLTTKTIKAHDQQPLTTKEYNRIKNA
jgi:hypothetical protein